ncbi:class I SAM-dependent methyltransferase [Nocardioides rotundus]|uniref:class I SAM-dependent methyltransferase n=1 Tax=Nocardioides rotundus TaxID=1774216 RepID=UPI001CC12E0B|nr:class I SAM-dependent methyltransferase [Nocardioides rotundus]UAL29748.1 class I SAM-dependent methyltransferase [Nocardioides rotundus]
MPDAHFSEPRLARLYDTFDADRSDLEHYVELIDRLGGRRVLDIGCGTGVLALMLADRGMEVTAVDPAQASLDVARAKPGAEGVTWVEADAAHLPVIEDIDVAVMTGNVAQCVTRDDEWGAALRRIAAVLRTGGHLIFETRDPARRAWDEWTPDATRRRVRDAVEGVVETWQQVTQVDLPTVSFDTYFRFPDTTMTSRSTLRFRTGDEIEQDLADAWLDLVEVRGAPDRPGHELVIARKPPDARDSQDRGWRDLARIDADLEDGRIDEARWHERVLALIEPAYLGAATPQAQSGKGGDAGDWEYSRRLLCDAIDRDGSFLDIGCANGLLMADVRRWAAQDGHAIEPHGVEIGPRLADLARSRYPQWAARIHAANANGWRPERRYDFVRTGLEYVPERSRREYVDHLMTHVVAPGGRLIIGVHHAPSDDPLIADLASWGYPLAGISRRAHAQPGLFYTALWLNGQGVIGGASTDR